MAGIDANGADGLDTALKLRGVPSISDTPKDAIFLAQAFFFTLLRDQERLSEREGRDEPAAIRWIVGLVHAFDWFRLKM